MSNGNGSVAPTCPISHDGPRQTSRSGVPQPGQVDVASIPAAHDLRTVITALNAMNNVVQHITRGAPQINNVYPTTTTGVPPPPEQEPPPQYARQTWREVDRSYREEKAVNPDDDTKVITIKVVAHATWEDGITGHTLIYQGQ